MRIADWFREHPQALACIDRWLEERRKGRDGGLRVAVNRLKVNFGYPFVDHVAFSDWGRIQYGERWVARAPKKSGAAAATFHKSTADVRRLQKRRDFIVTCAVNNSPVEDDFLAALEHLAEDRGAEIVVNPVRYRNPTRPDDVQEGEWWAPELAEYMLESEIRPHEYLSIMPTKVQATAHNPLLARLSGRTKHRSAVFGHPQLCMRTVPTPQEKYPKILYSSGAVTQKSYSDTVSGDMAKFHHTHSAVLVEVRGKKFHLREITWDGKCFIDLADRYTKSGISDAPSPLALVMGDIHHGKEDPKVIAGTFGKLVPQLQPERLVLHDLFDGVSVNPHEFNRRLTRAALGRQTNLEGELDRLGAWVNDIPNSFKEIIVVPSNHDDFLMRWLQAGEKNVEPENRRLYHYLCWRMLDGYEDNVFPLALEVALDDSLNRDIRFLKIDESYQVAGVELGMHGHLGPNGARGSVRNLSYIGTRSMVGHVHSPAIWQGVYAVGLSARYRHGYNVGPSSWLQTHGLVHANGRRQLIHFIGKDYKG